jgi:hypothetical protein
LSISQKTIDLSSQLGYKDIINPGEIKGTPINHVLLPIDMFGVHNDQIFDAIIIKLAILSTCCSIRTITFRRAPGQHYARPERTQVSDYKLCGIIKQ